MTWPGPQPMSRNVVAWDRGEMVSTRLSMSLAVWIPGPLSRNRVKTGAKVDHSFLLTVVLVSLDLMSSSGALVVDL